MAALDQISIKKLYGVGEVRAAAYARVGVYTVRDLLFYFPRAYENRGDIRLLGSAVEDIKSAVVLTVATQPKSFHIRRGMDLLKFRAFDDSGSCTVTFFNQNFLKDKFPIGSTFRFWGKVEREGRGFAMSSPAHEPYDEQMPPPDLYPVYRLTEGLSQKQLQKDMTAAMSLAREHMVDYLPDEIRRERGLCTLSFALRNIHAPEDYKSLAIAKRRLIFDEFFMFALGLATANKTQRSAGAPVCADGDVSPLLSSLPYSLTDAQLRTLSDIRADMASDIPMRRIVVGDVGCGKTICAAAAMYIAVKNGRQAALMAPTEILARQHYADMAPLFERLGVSCRLLVGATPAAQKRQIKSALAADGAARLDVVIGTHALISDGVEFSAPGLVVTDEQHRFGVAQRAALAEKSKSAHVLVMSATPIPRSLALVMYGDLDISKIDQMPPGRQRVDTFTVDESYRPRLDRFIDKLCGEGGQVYIVCPAIEERECEDNEISLSDITLFDRVIEKQPPLKAAEVYARELAERLPHLRVGLIHGRLSAAEKDAVMQSFNSGECQVLVSTTVIEVGVNVPNACLMIVENAERFGLSQLHQLRGRVGRGSRKSYCILVSDAESETARRRLETMRTTYDGYLIAETDLAMRGPGDFVGAGDGSIRQSGGVNFRLAGQCDDPALMGLATESANGLISADPTLNAYPELRRAAEDMFKTDTADIS